MSLDLSPRYRPDGATGGIKAAANRVLGKDISPIIIEVPNSASSPASPSTSMDFPLLPIISSPTFPASSELISSMMDSMPSVPETSSMLDDLSFTAADLDELLKDD
jgi:hypothetical protein